MSETIGKYLLSVIASAMLLNLTQILLPKGSVRKVAGFLGGLLIVLAVLSPVVDLDMSSLADSLTQFQFETEAMGAGLAENDREWMAAIIKDQCETYIWDKANTLSADLEVEVILSEEDEYPIPVSVKLTGKATPEQKSRIAECISGDMGIPVQRQEWNIR